MSKNFLPPDKSEFLKLVGQTENIEIKRMDDKLAKPIAEAMALQQQTEANPLLNKLAAEITGAIKSGPEPKAGVDVNQEVKNVIDMVRAQKKRMSKAKIADLAKELKEAYEASGAPDMIPQAVTMLLQNKKDITAKHIADVLGNQLAAENEEVPQIPQPPPVIENDDDDNDLDVEENEEPLAGQIQELEVKQVKKLRKTKKPKIDETDEFRDLEPEEYGKIKPPSHEFQVRKGNLTRTGRVDEKEGEGRIGKQMKEQKMNEILEAIDKVGKKDGRKVRPYLMELANDIGIFNDDKTRGNKGVDRKDIDTSYKNYTIEQLYNMISRHYSSIYDGRGLKTKKRGIPQPKYPQRQTDKSKLFTQAKARGFTGAYKTSTKKEILAFLSGEDKKKVKLTKASIEAGNEPIEAVEEVEISPQTNAEPLNDITMEKKIKSFMARVRKAKREQALTRTKYNNIASVAMELRDTGFLNRTKYKEIMDDMAALI